MEGGHRITCPMDCPIDCVIFDLFGVLVSFDDRLVYADSRRIATTQPRPNEACKTWSRVPT